MKNGLPLCLIGDSGTGKSHLLIALGTEAEMAGYRVKYMNSSKPPTTKSSPRPSPATAASICCASMKLGYLVLDQRGAELMFQVLTEREEKNSVAIASNESIGGWTKTFTDPRLCAAIVDRLTFGGNIIETGTDSYRLARTDSATST